MKNKTGVLVLLFILAVSPALFAQRIEKIYTVNHIMGSFLAPTAGASERGSAASAEGDVFYKQRKDFGSAVISYKKAVEYWPAGNRYFDLGNCLYFLGRYEESMHAFVIAARLECDNISWAYYNAACTASLMKNKKKGLYFLEFAFKSGYGPRFHQAVSRIQEHDRRNPCRVSSH